METTERFSAFVYEPVRHRRKRNQPVLPQVSQKNSLDLKFFRRSSQFCFEWFSCLLFHL